MAKENRVNNHTVAKKASGLASRIIDGEAVIVLPAKGLVRVLNQAGAFIWESIDGKRKIQEIARLLIGEFQVSEKKALADIKRFIEDLVDKGMVEIVKHNQ